VRDLKKKYEEEREVNKILNDKIKRLRLENENLFLCKENAIIQKLGILEKNASEFERRMALQLDENQELKILKEAAIANSESWKEKYNTLQTTLNRLQEEQKNSYQTKNTSDHSSFMSSRDSDFKSANASLNEEEIPILLNDLDDLEQSCSIESHLRKHNEELEKKICQLEEKLACNISFKEMTNNIQNLNCYAKIETVENLLERQNKSLEDQLATAREQAIIERQSARSANLTVWKLEKELETTNHDKTNLARKLKLLDNRFKLLQNEKKELEKRTKCTDDNNILKQKCIDELNTEIKGLKNELKHEHSKWCEKENVRMQEKSELVGCFSKIHELEIHNEELREKCILIHHKNENLAKENNLISQDVIKKQQLITYENEKLSDLEHRLQNTLRSYNLLKEVCQVMEAQLEEMEKMLNRETKQNSVNCDKNDQLWIKIRNKDDEIIKLKQELNEQKSLNFFTDSKIQSLESDINQMKINLTQIQIERDHQLNRLVDTSNSLLNAQEKNEILTAELSNIQRMNSNIEQQLSQLKEEKTKLLTDFYLAKEDISKLSCELSEAQDEICFGQQEQVLLKSQLHEQNNFSEQKVLKLEATIAQLQKLVDFLQHNLEHSHKKKATLADKLFGVNIIAKKENITPNIATNSYAKLQADLKKTQIQKKKIAQKLIEAKTDIQTMQRKFLIIFSGFIFRLYYFVTSAGKNSVI
jgi:citron Rho-interacting kinase